MRFPLPCHMRRKSRTRLPAKSECRYRTRDGWGSILQCFRKKMMKSANLKTKNFQFFFFWARAKLRSPGWEEMQAWREGRGRKRGKGKTYRKKGGRNENFRFRWSGTPGPFKIWKKKITSEKRRAKWRGKRKWLGCHTQPASHTVKKLFFFNGWRNSLSVLFQSKGSRIEPQPFLVRYLPFWLCRKPCKMRFSLSYTWGEISCKASPHKIREIRE